VISTYLVALVRGSSSPAGAGGEDMRPEEGIFRWAGLGEMLRCALP
jgi:hypothetical protein